MSDLAADREPAAGGAPDPPAERPAPLPGLIPYLVVAGADRAIAWYRDALGARLVGQPIVMGDGRIGHAELEVGGRALYLADDPPDMPQLAAPRPDGPVQVSIGAPVPDVDAVVDRAVTHGATLERSPTDHPYGRMAVLRDPFGHRWMISAAPTAGGAATTGAAPAGTTTERTGTSAAPAVATTGGTTTTQPLRPGDIGSVSLRVPDVERAAAFFRAVLGWTYEPQSGAQSRQVQRTEPSHGLCGSRPRSDLFLRYVVDDVEAAVERVRSAGGQAEEPTEQPGGRTANCADDQGTPFAVFTPGPDAPARRWAEHGARHGDLGYLTMEVRDSARAREFYGAVLGWRFTPGTGDVPDAWGVEGIVPMTALRGGVEQATAVPMYRVDDIEAAVQRVRAAGGRASDPDDRAYGRLASCTDDQGTRFYLAELSP